MGRSNFGDTDADTALADLHDGIRWSSAGAAFTVDMDVTVDTVYRLQMIFQEKGWQRGWDITVEGTVIAENISPFEIQVSTHIRTKFAVPCV